MSTPKERFIEQAKKNVVDQKAALENNLTQDERKEIERKLAKNEYCLNIVEGMSSYELKRRSAPIGGSEKPPALY